MNPFSGALCTVGRHHLERIGGCSHHRSLFSCQRCHAVFDDDGQILQRHSPQRPGIGPAG